MSEQLQFITDAEGARVGVLLGIAEYSRLSQNTESDPELLVGLSNAELEALATSQLAPTTQARVDGLLAKNTESQLMPDENAELENLLQQIDQLTILKTRARYTLMRHQQATQATA